MIDPRVEEVNSIVRKFLKVYDFRISPDKLEFRFVMDDENAFQWRFERIRLKLRKMGLIPMVKEMGGEYVLIVVKNPPRRYASVWINVVLLIASILSTIWVGMSYYGSYYGTSDIWHDVLGGFLYFSLPLMTILGIHEMGHYFAARRHNVAVSLPFFIPAPTMLGTLGAFISIREPIPDRRALVDIGLAGPIAGFIVAIPVTIIGMYLGSLHPPSMTLEDVNTYMVLNVPLIYQIISMFIPTHNFVHPTAMAGWVGFIVTAINLFPIGQLDGGHVARAIAGENTRYVSYAFIALLFFLGIWYPGWVFFALLVFFLGLRHPPPLNDITKLDKKRMALAVSGFLLLAVTFVPVPVEIVHLHENLELNVNMDSNILLQDVMNQTVMNISVQNLGEMRENVTVSISSSLEISNSTFHFLLEPGGQWNVSLTLRYSEKGNHTVLVSMVTRTGYAKTAVEHILCLERSENISFVPDTVHDYSFNTTLRNTGNGTVVRFFSLNNVSFTITNSSLPVQNGFLVLPPNTDVQLHFVVFGETTIIAVDQVNYQYAMLSVSP